MTAKELADLYRNTFVLQTDVWKSTRRQRGIEVDVFTFVEDMDDDWIDNCMGVLSRSSDSRVEDSWAFVWILRFRNEKKYRRQSKMLEEYRTQRISEGRNRTSRRVRVARENATEPSEARQIQNTVDPIPSTTDSGTLRNAWTNSVTYNPRADILAARDRLSDRTFNQEYEEYQFRYQGANGDIPTQNEIRQVDTEVNSSPENAVSMSTPSVTDAMHPSASDSTRSPTIASLHASVISPAWLQEETSRMLREATDRQRVEYLLYRNRDTNFRRFLYHLLSYTSFPRAQQYSFLQEVRWNVQSDFYRLERRLRDVIRLRTAESLLVAILPTVSEADLRHAEDALSYGTYQQTIQTLYNHLIVINESDWNTLRMALGIWTPSVLSTEQNVSPADSASVDVSPRADDLQP